jgi:hypothetical protein
MTRIDKPARDRQRLIGTRVLLPLGWVLAAAGYYGPWIAHGTAALTLSGVDMAEFVKFLPGVFDGSLQVTRQLLYLPPLAVVVSVALLVRSQRLHYPWPLRTLMLALAVPVSLQLLPPAWSFASLMTAEFRLQTVALGVSWVSLAGFWLWGRLPRWLTGSLSAALSLAAIGLSAWQLTIVKPAIDEVYGSPQPVGWGFYLCMAGLAIMAAGSVMLVVLPRERTRSGEVWSGE